MFHTHLRKGRGWPKQKEHVKKSRKGWRLKETTLQNQDASTTVSGRPNAPILLQRKQELQYTDILGV